MGCALEQFFDSAAGSKGISAGGAVPAFQLQRVVMARFRVALEATIGVAATYPAGTRDLITTLNTEIQFFKDPGILGERCTVGVTAAGITNVCPSTGATMASIFPGDELYIASGVHGFAPGAGNPVGAGLPAMIYGYRWTTSNAPNIHFSPAVLPPVNHIAAGVVGAFTTTPAQLATPTDCVR